MPFFVHARSYRRPTIDDPGGRKARLENVYGKKTYLKPDDIKNIMLRRARRVHDINLTSNRIIEIWPSTHGPEQETALYMEKLGRICDALTTWNCTHILRDALENLNGPVEELIKVDLEIPIGRLAEFEINVE
jgi:hypothetical protein